MSNPNEQTSKNKVQKRFIDVLELPDGTPVRLPIMSLQGASPGPELVLIAASHGWEVTGTEVIIKVMRERLDPTNLHGSVVAVPAANPVGFQRALYVPPKITLMWSQRFLEILQVPQQIDLQKDYGMSSKGQTVSSIFIAWKGLRYPTR